jgi:hypothetical protein
LNSEVAALSGLEEGFISGWDPTAEP